MEEVKKRYALITGASGGVGKAFANVLAEQGYSLVLTGRSEEKLSRLKAELSEKYGTDCLTFAADLSKEEERFALFHFIKTEDILLSFLANVAGADIQKGLSEYTQEKISFQCRVNFEAAVSACLFAIENRAERLQIVNVSSVSGIYPMPYFAIYSATKGALTSFSLSLREELKGKGVSVTAILPGAMPTREDIKEQIKGQGLWGRLAAKSPESVARISLKAVAKNKGKIVVGFWNKAMRIFTAWIPSPLKRKFIARRWSKISKDAF